MKADMALTTFPAITPLIEGDPILARMEEVHQSIVRRAYELYKVTGFGDRHDLEEWQRSVSEMLEQVSVQVTETDDEISMCAEVPGLSEEDIEIKVDLHRVFIAGKPRPCEGGTDESGCNEILRECLLPAEIDPEKVRAELKDGVLDVRLPKSVKSVDIQAASQVA